MLGTPRSSPLTTIGWAAYLACSWTWCIGMLLPILLVRDYGVWGFVVFALPNCIGAAAMGWFSRKRLGRIFKNHAHAIYAFSLVTTFFHIFAFAALAVRPEHGGSDSADFPLVRSASLVVLFYALLFGSVLLLQSKRLLAGGVVLLISLSAFVYGLLNHPVRPMPAAQEDLPIDLFALAPVCVFGFALCPYLDTTFHLAASRSGTKQRRVAFSLGFCGFFLLMILFTLWYAVALGPGTVFGSALLKNFIIIHLVAQAVFTCTQHMKYAPAPGWMNEVWRSAVSLAMLFAAMGMVAFAGAGPAYLDNTETVYRIFMSFYGLVFPAYVYLCVIPKPIRSPITKPTRRALLVWVIAVALAAPLFWIGLVEMHEPWLIPGLALVLAARLLIPVQKLSSPEPS